jgi:hypothetical protein
LGPRPSPLGILRSLKAAGAALALLLAVACGGDGVLPTQGGGMPSAPTLSTIQASIFTPRCAIDGCHAGSDPQQGLDLSDGAAHVHLVGVASTELAQYDRVSPGDPDDSYLVMKLTGDPRIAGSPMPLIGAPLDAGELDTIRRWIEAGAKND